MEPLAMPVRKDDPKYENLPHVKKVIDEAPPEYIIMIVVASVQLLAMTISLVHIVNKHKAFTRIKPRLVGPTVGLLTFYWIIALLNVLGLFVLRANLLCQAICWCYDSLVGYLLVALLISYSNGKVSYGSLLIWRDVVASPYGCVSLCCWGLITTRNVKRAITNTLQFIVIICLTSLVELICENEELVVYPAPLSNNYITFALKTIQALSYLVSLHGLLLVSRAASVVRKGSRPYIKLLLYKSIWLLSVVQGNMLLYMAVNGFLPATSNIAPLTRAVVWGNFATVCECTIAYFLSTRVYTVDDYCSLRKDDTLRTEEDLPSTLRSGKRRFKSEETIQTTPRVKRAVLKRNTLASYTQVAHPPVDQEDQELGGGVPTISIVDGKVNIALSSKDLAKLCKSGGAGSIPVNLNDIRVGENSSSEEAFEDDDYCSKLQRRSMMYVKEMTPSESDVSDVGELEISGSQQLKSGAEKQYLSSKISLV